jgi:hypothetical protein
LPSHFPVREDYQLETANHRLKGVDSWPSTFSA